MRNYPSRTELGYLHLLQNASIIYSLRPCVYSKEESESQALAESTAIVSASVDMSGYVSFSMCLPVYHSFSISMSLSIGMYKPYD